MATPSITLALSVPFPPPLSTFPYFLPVLLCALLPKCPNQVVLKPSVLTPLTATALASLAEEAGLPDGALNVVMGDAQAIGEQ